MTDVEDQLGMIKLTLDEFRKETREDMNQLRDCLTKVKVSMARIDEHTTRNAKDITELQKKGEKSEDRTISFGVAIAISFISATIAIVLGKLV